MAEITLKGNKIHICGKLPDLKKKAPDFLLTDKDLNDHTLKDYQSKPILLATVPSLDTGVCSTMTKHLNEFAKKHPKALVIVVSTDLPFAQKRFCDNEKVQNVVTLSMMRNKEFGKAYGLLIEDGPLAGILARSLIVLNDKHEVQHAELVPEITQEPKYAQAFTYFG